MEKREEMRREGKGWKGPEYFSQVYDGATENAGVENAIRAKMQGWKMQE